MKQIAIFVQENKGLESKVAGGCNDEKFYLVVHADGHNIVDVQSHEAPTKSCSRWHCKVDDIMKGSGCGVLLLPQIGSTRLSHLHCAEIEVAVAPGNTAKEMIAAYLQGNVHAPQVYENCPFSHEGLDTIAAHAGGIDPVTGSVVIPIYQTSTFAFENAVQGANRFAGKEDGYIYTRMGNPTVKALENTVAALEGGWGGLATSSGMSAVATVFVAFLDKNSHIVGTDSVYGPSRGVVERDFAKFGVQFSFVDTANLDEVRKAMRPNTKILYIETPANPTIKLADIAACAEIAHQHGALLVVDNTFMSPYLQRPFEMGADVVLHSMTKFLNGHADVVAGMIVARTQELYKTLYKTLIYWGGTMDPHQAYLVLRGIKTLSLRVDRAQENARKMAEFLEKHAKVSMIRYPGLKSHPQYELANKQMKGPGALISFEVKGGIEAGRRLIDAVHVCALAVSLGGVESLIQHPASMTHASMSKENREKAGITDGLIRLSIGCETYEDLRADLEQALAKV